MIAVKNGKEDNMIIYILGILTGIFLTFLSFVCGIFLKDKNILEKIEKGIKNDEGFIFEKKTEIKL